MDNVPHLALPISFSNGSFNVNQQDTEDEAAACVKAILSFQKDQRLEDPDFGIDNLVFETQPIDPQTILDAIATYEPRVDVSLDLVELPDGTSTVRVQVRLPTSDELVEGY